MRSVALTALALTTAALITPNTASACGGLFCGRSPVDQNAERIIFVINEDETTDMIVQITYQGVAEDFAWILPVADVPQNRTTFPQLAINALTTATDPSFVLDPECQANVPVFEAAPDSDPQDDGGNGGVDVIVREEVGPFELVVLQSDDADETADWLRTNQFRISEVMDQYVKLYTDEGMLFMALRLLADKETSDIEPIRFTLPGTSPGIPLRLTTVAAEPEMGVLAFIFGDMRYGPANADELEIDPADLRWDPWSFGNNTNWTALVARAVDRVGGRGWVAEVAGSTQDLREQVMNTFAPNEEQMAAQQALLELIEGHDYMSRLYTRLAPAEMNYDPIFKRSDAGDVDRVRMLPYVEELCSFDFDPPPPVPCDFAACGSLGLCVDEMVDSQEIATCACAPGSTARTTFDPAGRVVVSCQEEALSFLNPGDKDDSGVALPDACLGFDCGDNGVCVSMNMTPTCRCDQGYVARGWLDQDGSRRTTCLPATKSIPDDFYNRRPLERDPKLPVGREVALPAPTGPADVEMPDPMGMGATPTPGDTGDGMSGAGAASSSDDGCSVQPGARGDQGLLLWTLGLLTAWGVRRRRRIV